MEWDGTELDRVIQGSTVWYGVLRSDTGLCGVVRTAMGWYGVVQSETPRIGCPVYPISQ